jgi:hypothetical protein
MNDCSYHKGRQDRYTLDTAPYLIAGTRRAPSCTDVLLGMKHQRAMDHRQRGGGNALRFVEMLVGELRSVEEALVNGAERARDSFRTAPHLQVQ